ncbi:MAG: adenylate/guanylate cyclase domain-containing protein [Actinomycetota bacterium]
MDREDIEDRPEATVSSDDAPPLVRDPDRLPPLIRPAVDFIARIRAKVHTKLLAGFLVIAVLMLAMGVMSIFVIGRMNEHANHLVELQRLSDLSRQGIYGVTAQSHYRAMALTTEVDSWNDKIALAKQNFVAQLDEIEAIGGPGVQESVDRLREIDGRYADAGAQVLALYDAGDLDRALDLHISAEHEISHELENVFNALITTTEGRIDRASGDLGSLHHFLLVAVAALSGVSLLIALGLGAALSWSVIRPVRKMDHALARIAGGDFDEQIEVPNRDEFGRLTANLNRTSGRLSTLYRDLTQLNENLERTVADQLAQIRRAEQLRRYLAPQIADAVLSGGAPVSLESTRRNLTILFANIRGFTAMSERVEPEELIDALNEYFGVMTEVVFRHGGTLDRYVGDGILAFFGDPIPFEDHAERAVATAVEMRSRLRGIRSKWMERLHEELNVGIGISTGYVTVGNIGSDTRTEYTVIGNHVNLASGLAETAGANQILVSERTLAAVRGRVEAVPVDEIALEDVHRPVKIFEITRADFSAPASSIPRVV